MSRNKRHKKKPKIPKSKKPKVDDQKGSELLDSLKEIAIDWIEKPHTFTKTIFAIMGL